MDFIHVWHLGLVLPKWVSGKYLHSCYEISEPSGGPQHNYCFLETGPDDFDEISVPYGEHLPIRRGADKSLAFPICNTTRIIFLGWVKEVRTTKS
jgi:hypothetical protein